MDASPLGPFIVLQPRPVSGWPLRLLCDLDATAPNFLGHVLTASKLKRQCIFAAIAEMIQNLPSLAAALGRASNTACRDPFAQSAQSLVLLKPAQILQAIYGSVPDGLVGTLKRVGPDAFCRPTLYRNLFSLFAEPDQRERSDLIRQLPGTLIEERLEVALALDPVLLHHRVFERVTDLDDAQQVNAAVRLIQATLSTATPVALRRSLDGLPQGIGLPVWAGTWLRKLDTPLVEPPVLSDPDLVVLGVSDLRAASLQFRNCLRERVLHVAIGRDCYVVANSLPGTVAELRRTSRGEWILIQVWGAGNERPDQSFADEMRSKLEAVGIISVEAAVSQADLEPLAAFFDAFDLSSGWPPPLRRVRHRLQTVQEAA